MPSLQDCTARLFAPFTLFALLSLATACGGGTQVVLDQQLAADQARQDARAAEQASHAAVRSGELAQVPALVSAGLGVQPEVVAGWETHVTPGATAAVVRDPVAGLCSVVLLVGEAPRLHATGRPPAPLETGLLVSLGADAGLGHMALAADEDDLNTWTAEHCSG